MDTETLDLLANQVTPTCRVYRNAALTPSTGAPFIYPFDTTQWDSYGGFNTSTHLYTVALPGLYWVNITLAWALTGTNQSFGLSTAYVYQNGVEVVEGMTNPGGNHSTTTAYTLATALVSCSAGDTLSGEYSIGASTITIAAVTGATASYMSIAWLSPS